METKFSIEARDVYNNRIRVGGESFIVTIGLLEEGQYQDKGDGTYLGIYRLDTSGAFDLRVRNDKEIIRNPTDYFDFARQAFRLEILPDSMDARKSPVYGSGMQGVRAGYQGLFYIQSVDTFGNRIGFGGQSLTGFFDRSYFLPVGSTISSAVANVNDVDPAGTPGSYEVGRAACPALFPLAFRKPTPRLSSHAWNVRRSHVPLSI